MKKNTDLLKRIAAIALIAVLMLSLVACASSDSDDDDSVYIPPVTFVSPYVKMITEATHSEYGITYGDAFDSFFSDPEWSYFESTTGEDVVEFEGGFSYSGSPAIAKIQFVLDLSEGTFSAYHLSINGEDQSRLMLATMIQKVFESY